MPVRGETTVPDRRSLVPNGEGIDLAPASRGDSVGKDNSSDAPASVFDNNDHQDAPPRRRLYRER